VLRLPAALAEESLFDRVGDGEDLARGGAVADDKGVGEVAEASKIENEDVFGLLVDGGVDDLLQDGSQRRPSSRYSRCR